MQPTAFKLIMNDDGQEFEDQVNEALKDGYSFLGEFHIKENIFIQPMVKVEPITNIPAIETSKKEK